MEKSVSKKKMFDVSLLCEAVYFLGSQSLYGKNTLGLPLLPTYTFSMAACYGACDKISSKNVIACLCFVFEQRSFYLCVCQNIAICSDCECDGNASRASKIEMQTQQKYISCE